MEYDLSFEDVINEIFTENSGWYQGENFKDGCFLESSESDIINLCYFSENKFGKQQLTLVLSKSLLTQKYRRVFTQPEVMRKY